MSEIYHILNRGVDKRKIFLDKQDYFRFIHSLFVLNDQNVVNTTFYSFLKSKNNEVQLRKLKNTRRPRKLLVDIHAFCLMPNHYHLLLSSRTENGVSRFMHKLGTSYVKYFNQKYKRKGTLFEGRYKFISVIEESHFYHLPYYIHLNPLDLEFPEWRNSKLKNHKEALESLKNYRWSSHLDYIGEKNFPSVTNREFLLEVFNGIKGYKKSIKEWLKNLELENVKDLTLE